MNYESKFLNSLQKLLRQNSVEGLTAGLFQYDSERNALIACFEEMSIDTANATSATAASATIAHGVSSAESVAGHQLWVDNASILLIFTGNESKVVAKGDLYPHFAHKLIELEVGMIAQNALLAISCLPILAATPVGAFDAKKLGHILKLPKDEEPIFMLAVGRPLAPSSHHA